MFITEIVFLKIVSNVQIMLKKSKGGKINLIPIVPWLKVSTSLVF